ncbi:ABC transporter ATP-binding protein [Hydrogenimonas sp.]
MSGLRLEGVALKRGDFRLGPLSLACESRRYLVLLGPTGSGKTLLLEAIAGVERAEGEIWLNGRPLHSLPPQNRDIGFMYQDFALFPHLDVEENIRFAARYKPLDQADGYFQELCDFLALTPLLKRGIERLSGGEKQRVALARALFARPRLLLLDEPLSAVDPTMRHSVMATLKSLPRRFGVTVVHVTHNFREAAYLADTIAILKKGRLLQYGKAREVLMRPSSLETARFLGFKNIFPADTLGLGKGFVSIDPNAVTLSPDRPETPYALKGRVEEMLGVGDHVKLFLATEAGRLFVKFSHPHSRALSLSLSQSLWAGFDEEACLHFGESDG